ncbi:MAG: hypothetical protein U0694_26285 [Anaerolineae bacterium]
MIRVYRPNGQVWERTIDRRQNETINLRGTAEAERTTSTSSR